MSSKSVLKICEGKSSDEIKEAIQNLPPVMTTKRLSQYRHFYVISLIKEGVEKAVAGDIADELMKTSTVKPAVGDPCNIKSVKSRLKKRCKGKDVDYDLSHQDIHRLYSSEVCSYTGMTISKNTTNKTHRNSVTIDRIDNLKGYTTDNTLACSQAANTLKALVLEGENSKVRLSEEELLNFAQSMYRLKYGSLSFCHRIVKAWNVLLYGTV